MQVTLNISRFICVTSVVLESRKRETKLDDAEREYALYLSKLAQYNGIRCWKSYIVSCCFIT